jgi:hypothetical protein
MIMPPRRGVADTEAWTPIPVRPKERRRRSRWPLLAGLSLLVLAAGGAGAYYVLRGDGGSSPIEAKPAEARIVDLAAATAYDPPPADGQERNDLLGRATDGNPQTFWETEHYTTAQFGNLKKGVGIVFDARKPVRLRSLAVTSDTPGFTAVVEAGSSRAGPFVTVSASREVQRRASFALNVGSPERYYLVWITSLAYYPAGSTSKPYQARLSEVTGS